MTDKVHDREDRLEFGCSFTKDDGYRGGAVYFTRDFFDNAMHPITLYRNQMMVFIKSSLADFLNVPEDYIDELLQKESQPQANEREGQLQQDHGES